MTVVLFLMCLAHTPDDEHVFGPGDNTRRQCHLKRPWNVGKCVDGCNNIAIRIRMAVTDLRKDHVVVNSVAVDGCMGIFSRIIIVDKNVLGIDDAQAW